MKIEDRFFKKVKKTASCWDWKGSLTGLGYGQIWDRGKARYAHRVSYEIHIGEIPSGMCVLHVCDNPSCVRPNHIFIGSKKDNSMDMVKKGRQHPDTFKNIKKLHKQRKNKTHCKYGHAFSPENTGSVKGNGRYCRMCNSRNLVERYWNLKIQGFPRSQYVSGF